MRMKTNIEIVKAYPAFCEQVFKAVYDKLSDSSLAVFWFDSPLAACCVNLFDLHVSGGTHNTSVYLFSLPATCKL
jgi:hypothetical protein